MVCEVVHETASLYQFVVFRLVYSGAVHGGARVRLA